MPAILRIFLPKYNALITQIRPYATIGVVVGSGPSATVCILAEHVGLEHYRMSVGVGGVGLRPSPLEISITDVLGVSQEA